jgi:hypothetical protein
MANGMVCDAGRGQCRGVHNREGQGARRKAFERWHWRSNVVWAMEDVLGRICRICVNCARATGSFLTIQSWFLFGNQV